MIIQLEASIAPVQKTAVCDRLETIDKMAFQLRSTFEL